MIRGGVVEGVKISDQSSTRQHFCECCELAKMTKKTPNHELSTSIRLPRNDILVKKNPKMFQEVVTDLMGPFQLRSLAGNTYVIHFTDLESKYRVIYFMKSKEETKEMIERFHDHVKEIGHEISILKSDNGTEFSMRVSKNSREGSSH
jgi:hypothetical protein